MSLKSKNLSQAWESQHLGGRGRKIRSSKSASVIYWVWGQPSLHKTLSQTKVWKLKQFKTSPISEPLAYMVSNICVWSELLLWSGFCNCLHYKGQRVVALTRSHSFLWSQHSLSRLWVLSIRWSFLCWSLARRGALSTVCVNEEPWCSYSSWLS